MSGFKLYVSFLLFLFCLSSVADEAIPVKKQKPKMSFFSASLGHWQEAAQINQEGNPLYELTSTSLALGAGLGYVIPTRYFSILLQGQVVHAKADVGFPPGQIASIDFSGQNTSLLGVKLDFSFIARLSDGVGIGVGVPLIGTFFINSQLAQGYSLTKKHPIGLGAFLTFRIRRNHFVFAPKTGFLNHSGNFFACMDFNFHF